MLIGMGQDFNITSASNARSSIAQKAPLHQLSNHKNPLGAHFTPQKFLHHTFTCARARTEPEHEPSPRPQQPPATLIMKVTRRNNDDAAVDATAVTDADASNKSVADKSVADKAIMRAEQAATVELKSKKPIVFIDTVVPKTPTKSDACVIEGALSVDEEDATEERDREDVTVERELLPDNFDPTDFMREPMEELIKKLYNDLNYKQPYMLPNTQTEGRLLVKKLRLEQRNRYAEAKRKRCVQPMSKAQRELLETMDPDLAAQALTMDEARKHIAIALKRASPDQVNALRNMGVPKRLIPTARNAASAMIASIGNSYK